MGQKTIRRRLDTAKGASTSQLLFKAARLVDESAVAEIRAASGKPFRRAHTGLFPHIDLEGTRLTVLAQRVGTSKQAVAQLVDELVDFGVLVRLPDPDDGRAKRIAFAQGGAVLLEGLDVLRRFDEAIRELLGADDAEIVHRALARIVAHFDAPAPDKQRLP